jgi:hypothetical protein
MVIGEMGWVRKGWGCVRREEWCVACGVVRKTWKGEKGRTRFGERGEFEFVCCLIFHFMDCGTLAMFVVIYKR